MKNNIFKILMVLITGSFILSSCLLNDPEVDFGEGPVLSTFVKLKDDLNIIKDDANTPVDYQFTVTYNGGKGVELDRDVQVSIATSSTSVAKEGVEFELVTKSVTIPAGEKTAKGSIRVLTGTLVPFVFKDVVLEITDSSISISEKKTTTITLKALDKNTLAGVYDVTFGGYYRQKEAKQIGTYGGTVTIEAISLGLYKHVGIGFWPSNNDFFFTVDSTTGVITILDKDLAGEPTLLNTSPIMTCDDTFNVIVCDDTTNVSTIKADGHHEIKLTTGYFRAVAASGTREFHEVLVRQ